MGASSPLYHATGATPELIFRDGLLVNPPVEALANGMGWDEEADESWCEPGVYGFLEQEDAQIGGRAYVYRISTDGLPVLADTRNLPGARMIPVDVAPDRITLVWRARGR
jgi:hypothetical protein